MKAHAPPSYTIAPAMRSRLRKSSASRSETRYEALATTAEMIARNRTSKSADRGPDKH
jgi:hypothetical protein